MANALSGAPLKYRKNALGDYRAVGNGRSPMSAVNALQALSMIPGVGDIIGPVADAAMYYDQPETRTPGNFALSGLGLLPFVPGLTVFHGSPHKFDAFDLTKIGTGEGAQAYGHGLYLAESPEVAKSYQTALSAERGFSYGGKTGLTRAEVQDMVNAKYGANYLDGVIRPSGVADSFIDDMLTGVTRADGAYPRQYKHGSERAKVYDELRGQITHADPGSLYTVDLPDEAIDRMLDWDKPLSEQPVSIRYILKDLELPENAKGADIYKALMYQVRDGDIARGGLGANAQEMASQELLNMGIPGIKYLDQGSRASGKGTRNFVVFDDKLAKIIKRE